VLVTSFGTCGDVEDDERVGTSEHDRGAVGRQGSTWKLGFFPQPLPHRLVRLRITDEDVGGLFAVVLDQQKPLAVRARARPGTVLDTPLLAALVAQVPGLASGAGQPLRFQQCLIPVARRADLAGPRIPDVEVAVPGGGEEVLACAVEGQSGDRASVSLR